MQTENEAAFSPCHGRRLQGKKEVEALSNLADDDDDDGDDDDDDDDDQFAPTLYLSFVSQRQAARAHHVQPHLPTYVSFRYVRQSSSHHH